MTDQFASQYPFNSAINGCFVVQNIINNSNKTIRVFDYPIPVGHTRDLLKIPGVSESSIRASLLKGLLRNKLIAKEIRVICSDIDLIQFNNEQKIFLIAGGITTGIEPGNSGNLRDLINFIDEGPAEGFASGAYKVIGGQPFPTSITWYTDSSQTQKIVEKLIVRGGNQNPSTITWNSYNEDGVTILHTVVDTINYINDAFEETRARMIA